MSLRPFTAMWLLVLAQSVFQTHAQTSQDVVDAVYASIAKDSTLLQAAGAYPSAIVSLGSAAPVFVNPVDNVVVTSSSTYGKGRVVVFSHEALVLQNEGTLLNAAIWAAASAYEQSPPGQVGVAFLNSGNDLSKGKLPEQVRGPTKLCVH